MAATAWKGHLSFGLISIPVRLYPAARKEGIQLHQIHKKCHTRIKQPLFCPTCNKIVDRSEIIKGYEYEKDQYVLLEEDEVKKIAPPSERTMEIQGFVKATEVDPLYFHASYLTVPERGGEKAYHLLLEVLEDSKRAAIAKMAMHQREYLVLIRPRENGLTLHTMYYANEVRQVAEYGKPGHVQLKPEELKLAKQLVENLSIHFQPEKYHDEYQQRLRDLIESKRKGEKVTMAPEKKLAPVIDMMEALKKSLASSGAVAEGRPKRRPERERKTRRRAS